MSQHHDNDSSFRQDVNPAARLNPLAQHRDQPSFFHRLLSSPFFNNISKKDIIKCLFLLIVITLTFWMASSFLHETLIKQRTPSNFGHVPSNVQQIAAPDQVAYRSFYYFKKMVKMAKQNVKNKQTFRYEQDNQFTNIGFWQLYGIFKVVKAIQLANKYEIRDINDDGEEVEDDQKYDKFQNLTSPVNLTEYFTRVPDQARCSSCYSFPITATIQYQYTKKTGKKVKLSQQEIIDCSNTDENANGCQQGNITRGFQYARDIGLVQEKAYPYRSQGGYSFKCNKKILQNQNNIKYKIKGIRQLPSGNCKALQLQLVNGNAVAAMINVGNMGAIRNYSQPFRQCPRTNPNHAVTVVGQTQNQDWIVRNSWGESWGNMGYFILKKGNTCGICNYAMVPYLEGQTEEIKVDVEEN